MLNQYDIIVLESLNYFNEQEDQERKAMKDYEQLLKYQEFKREILQYGYYPDEVIQEMWEAEQLVEHDL